jgi:hypothetical protein
MIKIRLMCFVIIASLLATPLVFGQGADRGGIQGIVTDKSGAVVPGVAVSIKNLATSMEMVIVSEAAGVYRFPSLLPGSYYLRAELTGFTPFEVKTVIVNVGRVTDVNIVLEPKGTQETITVSEMSPLIETTKTDVGGVVDNREVNNLPLNSRNFSALATLIPGARPVTSWDPTKTRIGAVSIAGAGGRNVNTTVDGVDNKDSTVGGWVQNVPMEGIKEFALKTQRFSAADGRSQGGLLSIVTKSGSNDFHGSWFTQARDKVFDANDYFSIHNHASKADFRRWQWGGSVGGPIVKNKLFFFFTAERFTEDQFAVVNSDVLHEMQLLVDNKISIYGAVPQPSAQIPTPYKRTMWTARADWVINNSNNFYVSWNNSSDRNENDQTPIYDLSATNFNTNRNYLISAVLSSTIGAKMVNQFVWGHSYWNNLIDTDKYSPTTITFPSMIYGTNGNVPQQSYQKKWQFKDALNWNKGSHALRFGIDWVFEPKLGGFFGYTPVPAINFFDDPSTILTDRTHYPQGFSTPGIVTSITESNGLVYSRFDFADTVQAGGWYFQDDWRVSRKLTLNLGLRYDVDLGLVTAGGILANDRTYLAAQKINDPLTNGYKGNLPKNDRNNYAPRIGFAYDPTGKGTTVIRGGYGIYFDQQFININLFAIQQSNPIIFGNTVQLVNDAIGSGDMPRWIVNSTPLPANPSTPLTDFPPGGSAAGRLVDPNYVSPMAQQWNVGFSHEFLKDFVLEADYNHVLNLKESRRVRLNYKVNGVRRLTSAFRAAGIDPTTWGEWYQESSVNRSRYDGLNIGIRKRLSHRLTFQTSYVLSKSLGYGGRSGEFGAYSIDQTNYLGPNELTPTARDERHRFVWSGVIDLPWGFQVAPIVQLASARPYTLTAGTDRNGDGYNFDLCVPGTVGAHNFVCPQNVARNSQRGGYDEDGNWQSGRFFIWDLRVTKFINLSKIREGMSIGLFFEQFNLTNRTNFGRSFTGSDAQSSSIRSSSFMTSSGLATATYGLDAAAPYQAQLGIRFTF